MREIAQRPHPTGSADNARVRDYVLGQLHALGSSHRCRRPRGLARGTPLPDKFATFWLASPGGPRAASAVVLMAHYDGVAGGPAAGDDAAGTAAVLETVRALQAGPPLAHDVMVVITDGEEAGLLGAAAFVREHPWARDVAVTLNFEARGTTGRSYMFETGAGNLDVARVLRHGRRRVRNVALGYRYRSLPNDTDLSEWPCWASRRSTSRSRTAWSATTPRTTTSSTSTRAACSTMARRCSRSPAPSATVRCRGPVTGDAVFFDLPFIGLIVYPESWVLPIAIVGLLLVAAALVQLARDGTRWIRGVTLGAGGTIVSTCAAAGVATASETWSCDARRHGKGRRTGVPGRVHGRAGLDRARDFARGVGARYSSRSVNRSWPGCRR